MDVTRPFALNDPRNDDDDDGDDDDNGDADDEHVESFVHPSMSTFYDWFDSRR